MHEVTIHKPTADTKVGVIFESSGGGATTVSSVAEGSLSATAGMQQGQTIVSINGTVVTGSTHCTDLIKAATGAVTIVAEAAESLPVYVIDSASSSAATAQFTIVFPQADDATNKARTTTMPEGTYMVNNTQEKCKEHSDQPH